MVCQCVHNSIVLGIIRLFISMGDQIILLEEAAIDLNYIEIDIFVH